MPPLRNARSAFVLLRLPLQGKLIGANVLVALVAMLSLLILDRRRDVHEMFIAAVASLWVSVLASAVLIRIALQPLRRVRAVLNRVSQGELAARIPYSPVADRDLMRVGETVNTLLDELVVERARMRQLARDTIRTADEERSRIARGLHDSTAQTLAALSLEARMALQSAADSDLTQQLELIKDLAIDALEEVRDLSHTIHPRVLDDLGLGPALGWLSRTSMEATGLHTSLRVDGDASHLPLDVACTLFRVAEAALAEASRHGALAADATLVTVPTRIDLHVTWDAASEGVGSRLAALRERLALAFGSLTIDERGGRGVHVHASVPLGAEITQETDHVR